MATIGVICEYDPFHLGHEEMIRQARRALGDEAAPVVCVQSGDFVQRGEAALWDKFARAEAACRCGADLAIELPLPWVLSSAEGFARGGVGLLSALGVSHIAFGSESGDLPGLERLAEALLDPRFVEAVKQRMTADGSLSFPAAREQVAWERLGDEPAELLRRPNDILAMEYLKQVYDQRSGLKPLPILRRGAGHDESGDEGSVQGPLSASQLRRMLRAGRDIAPWIPAGSAAVIARERARGREILDPDALDIALLSRLRMLEREDFLRLPDARDGAGERLWRAVQEQTGLDAVLAAAKTKRYAMARLRRMALCAALQIPDGLQRETPPYARVLAFTPRGQELLHSLSDKARVPLVTKPAALRRLGGEAERVFSLTAKAHDLYVLGRPAPAERRPGEDWRTGPWRSEE